MLWRRLAPSRISIDVCRCTSHPLKSYVIKQPEGCSIYPRAVIYLRVHLRRNAHILLTVKSLRWPFTGGLHQSAQIFPNGLEFGTDGFEAFNHLDVSVDNSSLVAFDHVAGSLQGHAAFFH